MSEIFYISDTHFGSKGMIEFDKRPFSSVKEMEEKMIYKWNKKVDKTDEVYILGDFSNYKDESKTINILNRLNGSKTLIKGNHDYITQNISLCYSEIKDYKVIKDKKRIVHLSHFPMPFFYHDEVGDSYMLFGHLHNSSENKMIENFRKEILSVGSDEFYKGQPYILSSHNKCQFCNVGCMLPYIDYTPQTLDEIINKFKIFQGKIK